MYEAVLEDAWDIKFKVCFHIHQQTQAHLLLGPKPIPDVFKLTLRMSQISKNFLEVCTQKLAGCRFSQCMVTSGTLSLHPGAPQAAPPADSDANDSDCEDERDAPPPTKNPSPTLDQSARHLKGNQSLQKCPFRSRAGKHQRIPTSEIMDRISEDEDEEMHNSSDDMDTSSPPKDRKRQRAKKASPGSVSPAKTRAKKNPVVKDQLESGDPRTKDGTKDTGKSTHLSTSQGQSGVMATNSGTP